MLSRKKNLIKIDNFQVFLALVLYSGTLIGFLTKIDDLGTDFYKADSSRRQFYRFWPRCLNVRDTYRSNKLRRIQICLFYEDNHVFQFYTLRAGLTVR